MTIAQHPHDLFDARWSLVPHTGCWIWTGAKFTHGYGHFSSRYNGKKWVDGAHRISWQLHCGEIPAGLFVCHKCDTPLCVNPDHLFLGTSKENTRDAVAKGRMNRPIGETNNTAKLSEDDVLQILSMDARGLSAKEISQQFPVNNQSIRNIIRGKTWSHLRAC
jgi:hypothetical protein